MTLGDGHCLVAEGRGDVKLKINLSNGKTQNCKLRDVLYVPGLVYNLFSVYKAAVAGQSTVFSDADCEIRCIDGTVVAAAKRIGRLYYLTCQSSQQQACLATTGETEELWHRRYGHLGAHDLKKIAVEEMVVGLNYDTSKNMEFCEPCVEGKHHRTTFPNSGGKRCDKVLGLVHSYVCGKIGTRVIEWCQVLSDIY